MSTNSRYTFESLPAKTEIIVTGCENCPFMQCFDEINYVCTHPENEKSDRPLDYEFDIELTQPQTWCPMRSLVAETIIKLKV